MKLTVLGCSGGIGGPALRTTSLLIDDDILIDAGTGVGDLDLAALARIDHVFVTHAHVDHIACLPLMVDAVGERRATPLVVHCTEATAEALRAHLFNGALWPDFTRIPSAGQPFMRFETLELGERLVLGERIVSPLPANHTVPAVGYRIDAPKGSLAFSGDTTVCPELRQALAGIPQLRYLIIETAFPDAQRELAALSKHLCPSMLVEQLQGLPGSFRLLISHLKPGSADDTMREVRSAVREHVSEHAPEMLERGQVYWV
jgi:ribonuclease BN (tRNA processing enzyme)